MGKIILGWIVVQLIVIGLAGGGQIREIEKNGCINETIGSNEITFAHFWVPVFLPLAMFTENVPDRYICNQN